MSKPALVFLAAVLVPSCALGWLAVRSLRQAEQMRKVALVFVVAVFVPSLLLAWLAVRSLRDQEYLLQRQQLLLYQGVADAVASDAQAILNSASREFIELVGVLLNTTNSTELTRTFDDRLRQRWPLAQVGFVVTATGSLLCPSPNSRPDTRLFCDNNGTFLRCRESAEIYWNTAGNSGKQVLNNPNTDSYSSAAQTPNTQVPETDFSANNNSSLKLKNPGVRNVYVQQQAKPAMKGEQQEPEQNISRIAASEAEFCQLIGSASDGVLSRFVDNKLNVLFWYRPPQNSGYVFGAQVLLPRLIDTLKPCLQHVEPALGQEICIGLLDDTAKPVAVSRGGFQSNWKRPFAATEIGEALPHWEVAVYLMNPAKLSQSARTLKLFLGLVISLLVLAIGAGSWLIVLDLNRQLALARQKTDFVSNVSHELKTPLTSIRMFSELLAEGRVTDPAKQRSYLGIITAEAARLTRLINNVLDFARMERGEKKYSFQPCDLTALVSETAQAYKPHLESNGFRFECELPGAPITVNGDRDALAQVIVNLLSNAEKYSNGSKEIAMSLEQQQNPLPHVEVKVKDRGPGVTRGCEDKIFEQFYRAHDSLSSGIQGSGLGLTLARQIARAHGGDVVYQPREGGGSCFILRLWNKSA